MSRYVKDDIPICHLFRSYLWTIGVVSIHGLRPQNGARWANYLTVGVKMELKPSHSFHLVLNFHLAGVRRTVMNIRGSHLQWVNFKGRKLDGCPIYHGNNNCLLTNGMGLDGAPLNSFTLDFETPQ